MEQVLVVSLVLLWIVVICNLVLTLALIRRVNSAFQSKESHREGQLAPDFTAESLSGEMMTLATFAKREVVFLFVDPSCGPCREALPSYEALGPKAAQSGVDLVLVSTVDVEKTRRFVYEFGIQLPVLVAPLESNPFMKDYKLPGTPSFCYINREGKVHSFGLPSLKWGTLKALAEGWESKTIRNDSMATNERR